MTFGDPNPCFKVTVFFEGELSNVLGTKFLYIDFISHQNAASYTLHTTQHQNKNS